MTRRMNLNSVPGTDDRWYYGLIVRHENGSVNATLYEQEGQRRQIDLEGIPRSRLDEYALTAIRAADTTQETP